MNEQAFVAAIHSSMYRQCRTRGYAAPVDVLMDIGVLSKRDYENWRHGKVRYLEMVCSANLHRLSFIMSTIRAYARQHQLKPSFCYYKQWGVKKKSGRGRRPVIPLRFSKSGAPEIEKSYATHYLDSARIEELKRQEE